MSFYQILLSMSSEFCLINLFFAGLVYTLFIPKKNTNNIITPYYLMLFVLLNLFLMLCIYNTICSNSTSSLLSFFNNILNVTPTSSILELFILIYSFVTFICIFSFLIQNSDHHQEFILIYCMLTSSFILISKLVNLFVIVLILEISLIIFYAIIMFFQNIKTISLLESLVKFFLNASFSSILLLLGLLFLYKSVGSCNLYDLALLMNYNNTILAYNDLPTLLDNYISSNLVTEVSFLYLIPFILFFSAGLFFKFATVPFHSWSPDLYNTLPVSLIIIISTLPKLIYGFIFFKTFSLGLINFPDIWVWALSLSSFISFIYSVYLTIEIDNTKRFLAYSSIPHIATIFLSILLNNIFYLTYALIYFIMYIISLQSFLLIFQFNDKIPQTFSSLKYFFSGNKIMLFLFIILILQLAGLPPFSIFILKLNVLNGLLNNGFFFVYIIMVISSFYSIYYYMRIVKIIFFDKLIPLSNIKEKYDFNNLTIGYGSGLVFFVLLFMQIIFIFKPISFTDPCFYFLMFF